MRAMLVAAVLLVVALAGAQAQQMYRWVDKDGKVHYTQQPPPADARNVQRRALASGAPDTGDLPYATQLAAKNHPVTLYTSADCGQARNVLAARSVKYQEVEVSASAPESIEELTKVSGNANVPALIIGQRVQRGFDAGIYHGLLDGAGFPRPAAASGAAKR